MNAWPNVLNCRGIMGVVTDEGRDQIGILAWPAPAGKALGDRLAAELCRRLEKAQSAGPNTASHTIRRLLLLTGPPSIDAGEITDKGYINQPTVLKRRAALVNALHNDPGSALTWTWKVGTQPHGLTVDDTPVRRGEGSC